MQNIILILLSLLIIVVLGIIYFNYKKMNTQQMQLKKLELDMSALRNFIENRIMTQFPSTSSYLGTSFNDIVENKMEQLESSQMEQEEVIDEKVESDEGSDEGSDEESEEESDEESDEEKIVTENNVIHEDLEIVDEEDDAEEEDDEEEDDEEDDGDEDVDVDVDDVTEEQTNDLEEINSSELEQSQPNVDINLMHSIMMLGGELKEVTSDEDMEIIVKPRSKKPSEDPMEFDEGTIIKSNNDDKEYILKVNKKGKKRWTVIKS